VRGEPVIRADGGERVHPPCMGRAKDCKDFFMVEAIWNEWVKMGLRSFFRDARMVKSADTADLKSADPNRSWGFKSPSGHH
jgi:hypothetical protein